MGRKKKEKIVTKESIYNTISKARKAKRFDFIVQYVGKALVVLYRNQEPDEKASRTANIQNGVGFNKFDSDKGTRAAQRFLNTGTLPLAEVNYWCKLDKTNYPKIARYHKQLNDAAYRKIEEKNKASEQLEKLFDED